VTLVPTPLDGAAFKGWSTNCAGGEVTMDFDVTCSALFGQ
jgi:hypothetical protein